MASSARPNKPGKYQQGYYRLQNIDKYLGNPDEIIFRSSYEKRFCIYCDLNPRVKKWGSEIATIPYVDPMGKTRRYHVDFYIELEDYNTKDFLKKMLIEVKPYEQTKPPKRPATLTQKTIESYRYSLELYQKDLCKWTAAKQHATDHGMDFVLVTEKQLNMIK